MGVVLDTSALVTAERRGHSVPEILSQFRTTWGETEIVLSVVTIAELAHGIERAKLATHRQLREVFLEELLATLAVYPITTEIARRAGSISGQSAERGISMPFEDLLIGTTALHLGFEVATENLRHFRMIPNLVVKQV